MTTSSCAAPSVRAARLVLAGVVLSLALLKQASSAQADDRPSLGVEMIACDQVDRESVLALLALDLGARTSHAAAVPAHATRVTARCDSAAVSLEVIDPLTRKTVTRTIALERLPAAARARVLAIAIAELVSASWFELERVRHPQPEDMPEAERAAQPAAAASERAAALRAVEARSRSWRTNAGLGASLRLSPAAPASAWGGALQLAAYSPDSFALLFDLAGWYGGSELELGSASTVAFSLGAAGLLATELGAFTVLGGAGGRVGWAQVRGRSDDDDRARAGEVGGVFAGPTIAGGAVLHSRAWSSLLLLGELGYAWAAVRGRSDGQRASGVEALFGSVTLALHLRL